MNYLRDDAAMRNPPPEITTLVVDPSTLNINTTHSTPYEEPSDTIIPLIVPSIVWEQTILSAPTPTSRAPLT